MSFSSVICSYFYQVLSQEIGDAQPNLQLLLSSGGHGYRGRAQQVAALQSKVKWVVSRKWKILIAVWLVPMCCKAPLAYDYVAQCQPRPAWLKQTSVQFWRIYGYAGMIGDLSIKACIGKEQMNLLFYNFRDFYRSLISWSSMFISETALERPSFNCLYIKSRLQRWLDALILKWYF